MLPSDPLGGSDARDHALYFLTVGQPKWGIATDLRSWRSVFRKPARNAVYCDLVQALITVDLDRLILAVPVPTEN